MNDSDKFAAIKRQLRQQAQQLANCPDLPIPADAIIAESRRRTTRARCWRRCAATAATCLLLATIALWSMHSDGWVRGRHEVWTDPGRADSHVVHSPPRREPASGRANQISDMIAFGKARPALDQRAEIQNEALPTLVPVLIAVPEEDGRLRYTTGIYVPQETRPMSWSELTPVERRAVRRLLGENELEGTDPI